MTFSEKSRLVTGGGGGDDEEDYMEIDRNMTTMTQSFEKSEQIRKRNSFTALEVLERLTESRKATVLLQSVLLNMYCLPLLYICILS